MAISVKHRFVSAKVDSLDISRVQPSNWNDVHDLVMGPAAVIGRPAGAGTAAATEIPMGVNGQTLLATATAAAARALLAVDDTDTTLSAAAVKAGAVDADTFVGLDSAAGNAIKRFTWASMKATLKAYFDTLYLKVGGVVTALNTFVSSSNVVILATTGAGTVYFRPNGAGSAAGQAYIDGSGNLIITGSVYTAAGGDYAITNGAFDGRIAAVGTGGVGTYAMVRNNTATVLEPGSLVAGSNISYSTAEGTAAAAGLAGTWQINGRALTTANTPSARTTMAKRVA